MSMSVKLAMVAVNKSAITQLDHLSARVIAAILWLVLACCVLVSSSLLEDIAIYLGLRTSQLLIIIAMFQIQMSAKPTMEAVSTTVVTV
jgi:hypothetical protein